MEKLAGIIFGGGGPMLVLTSYASFSDPKFIEKLQQKGIRKFIAYEVPIALCKERYGRQYEVILADLHQTDDLRVLDYNGHNIFNTFRLSELGSPFTFEAD
jgi:hypothetical protein